MSDETVEYSTEELRALHGEEAGNLGWRMTFSSGTVKGDLIVAILPWPPRLISTTTKARTYLYRRNSLNGKYFLVKKD